MAAPKSAAHRKMSAALRKIKRTRATDAAKAAVEFAEALLGDDQQVKLTGDRRSAEVRHWIGLAVELDKGTDTEKLDKLREDMEKKRKQADALAQAKRGGLKAV